MRWNTHKYGAKRCEMDGYKFDSVAEMRRYQELKLMEKAGEITGLTLQPRYPITVNGRDICMVILDFEYSDNGRFVVEDFKGYDTAVSRLKRKLVEVMYDIKVTVVRSAL